MPFIHCLAGPSRLPVASRLRIASASRCPAIHQSYVRHVTATTQPASLDDAESGDIETMDAAEEEEDEGDFGSMTAAKRYGLAKAKWSTKEGYREFITGVGQNFRDIRKGSKANWLGGPVPFNGNPSFKPPPPLSNDLQTAVYQHLKKGDQTVGQLSVMYNVSKARIEGVKKLKEVEEEMVRQGLPLQTAFMKGMEPLLDARPLPPRRPRPQAVKQDFEARAGHPSVEIEAAEEARWDQGMGEGGSFGTGIRHEGESIERTAWEFRDEEKVVQKEEFEVPGQRARKAKEEEVAGHEAPEAPPTTVQEAEGKSTRFRFIDVSGQGKFALEGKRSKR